MLDRYYDLEIGSFPFSYTLLFIYSFSPLTLRLSFLLYEAVVSSTTITVFRNGVQLYTEPLTNAQSPPTVTYSCPSGLALNGISVMTAGVALGHGRKVLRKSD